MRALPRKFDNVGPLHAVRKFLDDGYRERVQQKVWATHAKGDGVNSTLWLVAIVAVFATFINLMISGVHSDKLGVPFHWCAFGTYSGIIALVAGIIGSVLAWVRSKPTTIMRERARDTCERAFNADPLVQRARLILEAQKEYQLHCNRYRVLRQQVDEEQAKVDDGTAEQYHAFIVQSNETIAREVTNLLAVIERMRRMPQAAAASDAQSGAEQQHGLSLLLAELHVPIEAPRIPAAADPQAVLDDEAALARVASELRNLRVANET